MPSPEMPDFTKYKKDILKVIRAFPSLERHYSRADLLQEAYIELVIAYQRGQLHYEKNISSWVWNVTRHHFLNMVERDTALRRQSGMLHSLVEASRMSSTESELSRVADNKEKISRIVRALSTLEGKQHDAVIQAIYHGLSFSEMAKRFGSTPDSWRMAYERGVQKISRNVKNNRPIVPKKVSPRPPRRKKT